MSISNYVSSFLKLGRIERALDIGAYRGEFTNLLKSIWPGIQVQQFEADERNKKYLRQKEELENMAHQLEKEE